MQEKKDRSEIEGKKTLQDPADPALVQFLVNLADRGVFLSVVERQPDEDSTCAPRIKIEGNAAIAKAARNSIVNKRLAIIDLWQTDKSLFPKPKVENQQQQPLQRPAWLPAYYECYEDYLVHCQLDKYAKYHVVDTPVGKFYRYFPDTRGLPPDWKPAPFGSICRPWGIVRRDEKGNILKKEEFVIFRL